MPFTRSTPLEIDGKTYPYYAVQLVISPRISAQNVAAAVVVNLTPYLVDSNGNIESRPDLVRPVIISDAYSKAVSDPVLAQALAGISLEIQAFIDGNGY